jgi:hypothetical protein
MGVRKKMENETLNKNLDFLMD